MHNPEVRQTSLGRGGTGAVLPSPLFLLVALLPYLHIQLPLLWAHLEEVIMIEICGLRGGMEHGGVLHRATGVGGDLQPAARRAREPLQPYIV